MDKATKQPIHKTKTLRLNIDLAKKRAFCQKESIWKLNSAHMLIRSKFIMCQPANYGPTRMHSGYICISGFILSSSGQM